MADDMLTMVRETLRAQIEKSNGLVSKINASTTDATKLVHDIRETDESVTDETVLAFRAWHEKVLAAVETKVAEVNDYIKANLLKSADDENFDAEAAKAEVKELRSAIKTAQQFAAMVPGYSEDSFSDLPELQNLRGGTSAGTGTGGKRPRLSEIKVNGEAIYKDTEKDGETVRVSNFTHAAASIGKDAGTKVEVKDLQAAAFAAAKTDDLSTLNGEPFSFSFSAGDKNYDVEVTPAVKPSEK